MDLIYLVSIFFLSEMYEVKSLVIVQSIEVPARDICKVATLGEVAAISRLDLMVNNGKLQLPRLTTDSPAH